MIIMLRVTAVILAGWFMFSNPAVAWTVVVISTVITFILIMMLPVAQEEI